VRRAYRNIAAIHRWLGDERFLIGAIRRDPLPVRRILDVGCGTGVVLQRVGRKLGVDVLGADIQPHPSVAASVPIVRADACRDRLPDADVTYCMHLGHHLSADDLILMIRNVGRSCRRFIVLDLVRHPVPLALFRMFVAPLICHISAEDGRRSSDDRILPRNCARSQPPRWQVPNPHFVIGRAVLHTAGAGYSYGVARDTEDGIQAEEGAWVR